MTMCRESFESIRWPAPTAARAAPRAPGLPGNLPVGADRQRHPADSLDDRRCRDLWLGERGETHRDPDAGVQERADEEGRGREHEKDAGRREDRRPVRTHCGSPSRTRSSQWGS